MASDTIDQSRRKTFGRNREAWVVVEIPQGGKVAYLKELCFGGNSSLTREDLVKSLADGFHITAGINEKRLVEIVAQAKSQPKTKLLARDPIVIAREVVYSPPQDGRVEFSVFGPAEDAIMPSSGDLKSIFALPELGSVLEHQPGARLVAPGQELARLIPPVQGRSGQNIYGRISIIARAPTSATLSAGEHVRATEGRYVSELYGYVCHRDGEISVVPPVWVSRDLLEAHFVRFPQPDGQAPVPEAEWLRQVHAAVGIREDIPALAHEVVRGLLADERMRTTSSLLVEGRHPVPGSDARLECSFALELEEGFSEDGGVDIDARRAALRVEAGEFIAEWLPPEEGQPGENLAGETIAAPDGEMRSFRAGNNVRAVYRGDIAARFYSSISGNAAFDGTTVEVNPVRVIEDDVDARTGDVEADVEVEINGSVRADVSVRSTMGVTVRGVVEDGASVNAKGDVIVGQGILGSDTRVTSTGDVATKFVQEGSVVARGDVRIGDHVFKGSVRSGGELTVRSGGGSRSGSIVGGEVVATRAITADAVGSEAGLPTRVGIGDDLEVKAKLIKLDENIGFANANALRIFRTLKIESLEPGPVKALLRRTLAARRAAIGELLIKLRELVGYKDESEKRRRALAASAEQTLRKAEISVSHRAHAGVQVAIGSDTTVIQDALEAPVFCLGSTGVTWRRPASVANGNS